MPGTSTLIKYPLALNESGDLCDIVTVRERGKFRCLNCQDLMVARLGSKRSHHFAHRPNGICASESFLHKAAKLCIVNGFAAAKSAGREYKAAFRCAACSKHDYEDLVPYVHECLSEYRLPQSDFRTDVAFLEESGRVALAVEIVVSNPPDSEKLAYYQSMGINLLVVRPDMRNIGWLQRNIFETEAPLAQHICDGDETRIRKKAKRYSRRDYLFRWIWGRDRAEIELLGEVLAFRERRETSRRRHLHEAS